MSFILESQCKLAEFSKAAQELSSKVLGQLRKLVLDVPNNKELFSDSTHYERVDKLVLWNSDYKAMQIRLQYTQISLLVERLTILLTYQKHTITARVFQ